MDSEAVVLDCVGVGFGYSSGESPILHSIDLTVSAGESLALVGPSGAGKTTLLSCMAGLLTPTAGTVEIAGHSFSTLSDDKRAAIRLSKMGFVFQNADLVAELTLQENVELPLRMKRVKKPTPRASAVLEGLGISHLGTKLPSQVSGGEAQRCAIARALVHQPSIVFADEPTGALDTHTGEVALSALLDTCAASDAALVMVTHNESVAARLARRVEVRDGRCHEPAIQEAGSE